MREDDPRLKEDAEFVCVVCLDPQHRAWFLLLFPLAILTHTRFTRPRDQSRQLRPAGLQDEFVLRHFAYHRAPAYRRERRAEV